MSDPRRWSRSTFDLHPCCLPSAGWGEALVDPIQVEVPLRRRPLDLLRGEAGLEKRGHHSDSEDVPETEGPRIARGEHPDTDHPFYGVRPGAGLARQLLGGEGSHTGILGAIHWTPNLSLRLLQESPQTW